MYIFILSLLTVSFISLCFFKSKFWENRYLVLLISASVALIVTLTANYITRNKLDTDVEVLSKRDIQLISFKSSLIDSTFFITKDKRLGLAEHQYKKDSNIKFSNSHYLLYYNNGNLKIGYGINDNWRYKYLKDVYIASSNDEKVAYYAKRRKFYKKRSSRWITDFSLPAIQTIKCIYLPPSEYKAIPDSLIHKLPF